ASRFDETMKTPGAGKKSTKSRSKSTKLELAGKNAGSAAGSASSAATASTSALGGGVAVGSLPTTPSHLNMVTTPTTPTSSFGNYNMFDASFQVASSGHGAGGGASGEACSNSSRVINQKSYAGFDPRSIKIFWEQHDQTDVELPQDVCARLAEDATYKVWELINNVKTYSRHSGGVVTYDLVNEVLKDGDVPPMLGAMDSDWDRIDYDGSYYFHSDKIFELREEFQTEITLEVPGDADFHSFCAVEDKHLEQLKQVVQNLVTAAVFADSKSQREALCHAFQTPLMGSIYRVIVTKVINLLAFKQQDQLSQRCWRLLRACNYNSHVNHISCRPEYFHLAEVLVCQLLAPYETIKSPQEASEGLCTDPGSTTIKMEYEEQLKLEPEQFSNQEEPMMEVDKQDQAQDQPVFASENSQEHTIYKLQTEDEEEAPDPELQRMSSFFASPVGAGCVEELCDTIGQLSSQSGYFHSECLFLITRRLARYFETRDSCSERGELSPSTVFSVTFMQDSRSDLKYVRRAVRGLIALGEYAFREFIPYIFKLQANTIPECMWQDLAQAAIFLGGKDDIYLYEWLEYGCGAALQPFMVHYARKSKLAIYPIKNKPFCFPGSYEKMITKRYESARAPAYRVEPVPGVRRLEWSTLAAAMCHGDDPSKALKPKPTLREAFPELQQPNLQHNCAGNIRFKFAGCRPVLLKPKTLSVSQPGDSPSSTTNGGAGCGASSEIFIAKRKLFKPLTNVRKWSPESGYHYLRI
ncbi:hypothetical protein KR074_005788, partial [Drosophila pseudoananassae]